MILTSKKGIRCQMSIDCGPRSKTRLVTLCCSPKSSCSTSPWCQVNDQSRRMTLALSVFGAVAAILTVILFVDQFKDRTGFGWRHVDRLIKKLLREMRLRGYSPDLVLGVGRGGAIVAGMIAGNIGLVPLAVLDTELRHENGVNTASLRYPECCPSLKDKSVLIVVGELYSGQDMLMAMKYVESQGPQEIKTVALLTHPASSVRPDFIGFESQKPLTAPWRISEDYKQARL